MLDGYEWDNFPYGDFLAAKKFAGGFYKTIGRIKCPALNGEHIAFNSRGICHILYKSSRNELEIIERLSYLCYAENIVSDPYAKIEYRRKIEKEYLKKGGNHQLCEVESQYWSFMKEVRDGLVVKVVIRQVDNGNKYFYSIMRRERG